MNFDLIVRIIKDILQQYVSSIWQNCSCCVSLDI